MLHRAEIQKLQKEFNEIIAKKRDPYLSIDKFKLNVWRIFNKSKYLHFQSLVVRGFSLFGAQILASESNEYQRDAALLSYRIEKIYTKAYASFKDSNL